MAGFLNLTLYQVGWFACVLGAAYRIPALGIWLAMALVGVHLFFANDRSGQVLLILIGFALGLVVDATLLAFGVYRFPSGMVIDSLPPPWMSVLWIQFATTLRYSFLWLSKRYSLSSLLGLVGAPLTFLAGERLGAIVFCEPRLINLIVLGFFWALAIPLLIYASDRVYSAGRTDASYRGLWGAQINGSS